MLGRYDPGIVLEAAEADGSKTALCLERVQLHCRRGDHGSALRVLALELGDVDSSLAYCRAQGGHWLLLLELLLR